MMRRKFIGGLAVLVAAFLFAAGTVSAAGGDKPAEPPETTDENQDHVVGEELC
ncbi:MAG: hypothetical protein ACTSUD_00135 [Alphaproteobacteria bacterium]